LYDLALKSFCLARPINSRLEKQSQGQDEESPKTKARKYDLEAKAKACQP